MKFCRFPKCCKVMLLHSLGESVTCGLLENYSGQDAGAGLTDSEMKQFITTDYKTEETFPPGFPAYFALVVTVNQPSAEEILKNNGGKVIFQFSRKKGPEGKENPGKVWMIPTNSFRGEHHDE